MKKAVLNLMNHAGAFAPFRLANRNKALIVTYHRFSETDSSVTTSARLLAQQLDYLTAHYQILPLSELAGLLASGAKLPSSVAAITIDDGYRDCYEIALPVLRRYNVPAALFVVTAFIDQRTWMWTDKLRYVLPRARTSTLETRVNDALLQVRLNATQPRFELADCINSVLKELPDGAKDDSIAEIAYSLGVELPECPPPEFDSVNWEQVREMSEAGIEIGSHTMTHPILTNVGSARVRKELVESRERIEGIIGTPVGLFCYPNGGHNQAIKREVARAGYRCAVTCEPGFNEAAADHLALRRIHTEPDLAHFVQSTSGFEQTKIRLRRAAQTSAAAPAYEH
jgi:peptidoglycan/xylan/chitin deacetylase (PgdA/CDA1 family)